MVLSFLHAYLITILIETTALFFLVGKTHHSTTLIIRNSLIANTLTLPFVWFVFPVLGLTYLFTIILSEIFVLVVETALYFRLFNMPIREAFVASLVCNTLSFSAGELFAYLF